MPWTQGGHPLEQKKVDPGTGAVMLRFAPGFADPNWCTRSHILFVVSGTLQLELETTVLTVTAGNACHLASGTAHRAQNPTQEDTVLLALSDL